MGGAKIAIIGAGDLGIQLAHLCRISFSGDVIGFFDDTKPSSLRVGNFAVLGGTDHIMEQFQNGVFEQLLVAIGYRHMSFRENLFNRFSQTIPFARIVHPNAYLDSSVKIGEGCVVMSGCTLEMEVTLNENVLVYNGCNLSHHCQVGAHSILSPSVSIAGFTHIGERNVLGIGSVFSDNLFCGPDCQTGAGTTVVNDMTQPGLYVGTPAKRIKE